MKCHRCQTPLELVYGKQKLTLRCPKCGLAITSTDTKVVD